MKRLYGIVNDVVLQKRIVKVGIIDRPLIGIETRRRHFKQKQFWWLTGFKVTPQNHVHLQKLRAKHAGIVAVHSHYGINHSRIDFNVGAGGT